MWKGARKLCFSMAAATIWKELDPFQDEDRTSYCLFETTLFQQAFKAEGIIYQELQ